MRKFSKVILMMVLICGISMVLSGCDESEFSELENYPCMTKISDSDNLYYRNDTYVVYIIIREEYGVGKCATGYGYMSPYISKNGRYCIYNDGKIQEIK